MTTETAIQPHLGGSPLTTTPNLGGPFTTDVKFDVNTAFNLRLVQASSDLVINEDMRPGEWYVDNIGHIETPVLMPLMHGTFRSKWDDDSESVVCRSIGGEVGQGNPGGSCVICPHSQIRADGGRPTCALKKVILAFMPTHNIPVRWELKGTALKVFGNIMTYASYKGLGQFKMELSSRKRTYKGYSWHIPEVKFIEVVDSDLILVPKELTVSNVNAGAIEMADALAEIDSDE